MLIQKGRYILEKKQQFIVNGKISICDINTKSNILVFGLTTGIFSIYDINTFENKYTLQITDNKINSLSINKLFEIQIHPPITKVLFLQR